MGILEDILKALDRVPGWKRITTLPGEVDELQKRVSALEARLARASGDVCPRCRAMSFTLVLSRPDPEFGHLGATQDVYRCGACNYERIEHKNPG